MEHTTDWIMHKPQFLSDALNSALKTSPWSGHRNFAYDLVCYLKPQIIVELGTHYGCSFFCFAQSITDSKLSTTLFGIDSWSGDEQAGFYGEDVFGLVTETIGKFPDSGRFLTVRSLFSQALSKFKDNSIDIIHIDGLHTYEAVKEDFNSWLPKLSNEGIMLFHDVNQASGYGSAKFWSELEQKYPAFSFQHSWGLGVLFPKGKKLYDQITARNWEDKMEIYELNATLDLSTVQVKDLTKMVEDRDKVIAGLNDIVGDRDRSISGYKIRAEESVASIKALENRIEEYTIYIKDLEDKMVQRWNIIEEYDKKLKETLKELETTRLSR